MTNHTAEYTQVGHLLDVGWDLHFPADTARNPFIAKIKSCEGSTCVIQFQEITRDTVMDLVIDRKMIIGAVYGEGQQQARIYRSKPCTPQP